MDDPRPRPDATTRLARALLCPPGAAVRVDAAADWLAARAQGAAADDGTDDGTGRAAIDRAILASVRADRLAWPFLEAYQAAVRERFAPSSPAGALGSFLANEAGRRMVEIDTRLTSQGGRLRLDGAKSWCLRAADPFDLYVLARRTDGPARGPGSLAVVAVRSDAAGVALEPGRAQRVVPELPHASVRFEAVPVAQAEVLPGDGYADHARPFRRIEDLCLAACALAWLLGEAARRGWPATWRERALAAVLLLRGARGPDAAPETELAALGALQIAAELFARADGLWETAADDPARERWRRDRALLEGAGPIREARASAAWRALAGG